MNLYTWVISNSYTACELNLFRINLLLQRTFNLQGVGSMPQQKSYDLQFYIWVKVNFLFPVSFLFFFLFVPLPEARNVE